MEQGGIKYHPERGEQFQMIMARPYDEQINWLDVLLDFTCNHDSDDED